MHINDLVELDRRAVAGSVATVQRVRPGDLGRPTPCADWDLTALLAHMTAQHRGFAAAAAGHGADPDVWRETPADDPVAAYAAAAEAVTAAFATPAERFVLPEITRAPDFPAAQAIGFHLVDYVVHGWDVAAALGVPYPEDDAVLAAALDVARAVPDGAARTAPGSAFAPSLATPPEASTMDTILALLGRDRASFPLKA
ncbi:MAG TPA: TIGR03086 family metal-binding protein [Actinocatenispora sp.]